MHKTLYLTLALTALAHAHTTDPAATTPATGINSPASTTAAPTFDLIRTLVTRQGSDLVFSVRTSGQAGTSTPTPTGKLAGSNVFSYVWPTSLDSSTVGFEKNQGVLALAVTSHPDFDDTPLHDENGDGNPGNDGNVWHAHWVVLVPDDACGPGALKVKDITAGTQPRLPATWPNLPILIDSPNLKPTLRADTVTVRVPLASLGFPRTFRYDGVTAGLRVNANLHAPLLCVTDVFKVASGKLTLPGQYR